MINNVVFRTVYRKADVYLLDDPLSAVDSKVESHIIDKWVVIKIIVNNNKNNHAESPFCKGITINPFAS